MTEGDFIPPGTPVRITSISGRRIFVEHCTRGWSIMKRPAIVLVICAGLLASVVHAAPAADAAPDHPDAAKTDSPVRNPRSWPALRQRPRNPSRRSNSTPPAISATATRPWASTKSAAPIEEAKSWGCTSYGDWFDMLDCSDPFRAERQIDLGRALWNAKKANFRSAMKVGRSRPISSSRRTMST